MNIDDVVESLKLTPELDAGVKAWREWHARDSLSKS